MYVIWSHLTRDQHGFFLGTVHESNDRPRLSVKILHFRAVPEVIYGHLASSIAQYELSLPVRIV